MSILVMNLHGHSVVRRRATAVIHLSSQLVPLDEVVVTPGQSVTFASQSQTTPGALRKAKLQAAQWFSQGETGAGCDPVLFL